MPTDDTAVKPKTTEDAIPYNSNPFTISINGFQLLAKYAQSIIITILVLGLISFTFNLVGQVISTLTESSASAQQDDVSETLESISNDIQLEFDDSETDQLNSLEDDNSSVDSRTIINIAVLILGIFVVILLVTLPIGIAFSAAYKGFIAAGMIASLHHKKISFGEALSEMGGRFGTLFVAELIATLKIIGGYLLFIIPGARAQLRYEALPYVIMNDTSLGARAAVTYTKDLYKKHLMEVFGIKFFASIIPAIGPAFAAGGISLSMQQIQAYKNANQKTPRTHWLNYLGLLLVLAMFLFIGLMIALVVSLNTTY